MTRQITTPGSNPRPHASARMTSPPVMSTAVKHRETTPRPAIGHAADTGAPNRAAAATEEALIERGEI